MTPLPAVLLAVATVALELPDETDSAHAERAVESCNAALGAGACVLARSFEKAVADAPLADAEADGQPGSDRPGHGAVDAGAIRQPAPQTGPPQAELGSSETEASSGVRWVARVSWRDTRLVVTLEDQQRGGAVVSERELRFDEADRIEERWVAAGLMAAAMSVAQSPQAEPAPAPPEPEPAPSTASIRDEPPPLLQPEATSSPVAYRIWIDAGGQLGQGLDQGPSRYGAVLRGWWLPRDSRVGPVVSLRGAWVLEEPEVRWLGGEIGLGIELTDWAAAVGVQLYGVGAFEQVEVAAVRGGQRDRVTTWRGGGRLGLVATVRASRWVVPWISLEASVLRPELDILLESQPVGHESSARWAVAAGLRLPLVPAQD